MIMYNNDHIKFNPRKGLEFRMGLTFWSDRTFEINESNDGLYHCALPLTNITSITENMISTAFQGISKMYGGGDAEEDVLLGQFKEKFHISTVIQVSFFHEQIQLLVGLMDRSNKFIFSLTIRFIITAMVPVMD